MYKIYFILQTAFLSINSIPLGNIETSVSANIPATVLKDFPDSGRQQAVLEQESILSLKDSTYGHLQNFVASFYNPKPIIDTIEEHEKYGNDGEKFRRVGTAVVGGIEKASNFLNAAVELPFAAAKQIGKSVTDSLNRVGGKIVGL